MIVGTWLASSLSVDALRKSESQNLEEVATQLRDKIEFDLNEQYSNLKVAAAFTRPHLQLQQPASVTSLLDALHANYPSFAWIGLTDPAGKVLASTGSLLLGADVSQRPWFKQGSQKPYLGDAHEALLLASKLANTGSAPLRLLDLAVPIRSDDGTLLGVLGAHLYLDWVAHMGKDLLTPVQQRLHARFLVADANGVVIIGPTDSIGKTLPDRLVEQSRDVESGYLNTRLALGSDTADAGDYLVGFSRLRNRADYAGLDWLVLVRKPTSDAFMPARDLERSLIIVSVLVTLAMILFALA
ncbi:MAG: cache domain-containing protein, partial [Marinobacter sp.]|nr:cache domain-containing protein [Marinobacter sp.]